MEQKKIGRYKLDSSLNEDQKKVFTTFETGKNIFINGSAGVGKSYVLKQLVTNLDWSGIRYGLTAMTGTAALQVGGMTLHSWSGIGLGEGTNQQVLMNVLRNKKAVNRIKFNKVLIVDEISMAKASLLEKLDFVFRSIRTSQRPFGGLQMVFCGDGLQLPPVFRDGEDEDGLFFEAKSWINARVEKVTLTEIVRQQGDQRFAKLLNEVRVGNIENISMLQECVGRKFDKGINPVKLYSKNVNVDNENNKKLSTLSGPSKIFKSIDFGLEHHIQFFNKNCPAPQNLELKVGAQVMLLKNLDLENGLCNGSIGVVSGFTAVGIEVTFDSGKTLVERESWEIKEQNINTKGEATVRTVAERSQYPLKLAWAITIHKCVHKDSLIFKPRNTQYVNDLTEGEEVHSIIGENKVLNLQESNKDILKITTRSGYEIKVTPEHKLLKKFNFDKNLWEDSINLSIGDNLILRKGVGNEVLEERFNNSLDFDFGWWLGCVVGDGSYNYKSSRIDFCNIPKESGLKWKSVTEEKFGVQVHTYRKKSKANIFSFENKSTRDWLESVGLGRAIHENKSTPWIVFSGDKNVLKGYLKGLIDTDGHLTKCEIGITSKSEKLIGEIQSILLILGFESFKSRIGNSFRVSVLGSKAYKLYLELGLTGQKYKQANIEELKKKANKIPKRNIGNIPGAAELAKIIQIKLEEIYGKKYGKKIRIHLKDKTIAHILRSIKNGKICTYDHFNLIREKLNISIAELDILTDESNNGFFLEQIKSIEIIRNQKCYDFEVENEHCYIANGFVSHNCQGATLDHAEVDVSEAFTTGMVYVALSRVRDMKSLSLKAFNASVIKVNKKALEYSLK